MVFKLIQDGPLLVTNGGITGHKWPCQMGSSGYNCHKWPCKWVGVNSPL